MAAFMAACTAVTVIPVPSPDPDPDPDPVPVPDPDPLGSGVVPRSDIAGIGGVGGGKL